MARLSPLPAEVVRAVLAGIAPYEAGKPIEEVQRELGLERVAKLASNEGQFGPFPAALRAIEEGAQGLNRYPDGAAYQLRSALAERHGVTLEEVTHGAGVDAVIEYLSQALLDPGDEIVVGWPSFVSYPLHALKLAAVPARVPLREQRLDLTAMLAAIGPRTKIVYIANPNNPTGTMNSRAELDAYFGEVPEHVLTVLDEAYFEYVEQEDYPDGIEEYAKQGARAVVLRTFSKVYGLAGLRVGYGIGPPEIVAAIAKVRPAFDLNALGQQAALASLSDEHELQRRRAVNRTGLARLSEILVRAGLRPVAEGVANFLCVDLGRDSEPAFQALLRRGVVVRPLRGFGAPTAIRITVGTEPEHLMLEAALADLGPGA
ncbi:MAG: histidinol-phosphate transaminase [Gaiellaceae bacterium]